VRHVVFFNRSYYPDNAATGQLLTELAEDLVRHHGCRVTVVAGVPLQAALGGDVTGRGLFSRDSHNGVHILRARGTRLDKQRFAGRAANYLSYFASACWASFRLDKADVVVALTDPPIIGLAAWLTAKRHRAPFVMSYRDLFPEVAALLPDFHSPVINRMLQAVNVFLCRRADRVIALGETMRTRLIENKKADPARTLIIPDWADTRAIAPGPKRNAFAEAHGLSGRFVVMHSGNMGLSQSLETIVEAAALLQDVPDITVVFQGEGVKKPELQARVAALGLTNVCFLPYAPKERLGESFAAADVFVVSLQRGLAGYIVPSKLYGILAAGRPYVAAVEESCETAALTVQRGCGLVAEPGDARALADCILTFYSDRDLTQRCGARAREAGLYFDRTRQVANYAALFDELCVSSAAPDAEGRRPLWAEGSLDRAKPSSGGADAGRP
jgi:glycosyltransferase involved in cell wall biosynthesis